VGVVGAEQVDNRDEGHKSDEHGQQVLAEGVDPLRLGLLLGL
jgi:hypothetical protein